MMTSLLKIILKVSNACFLFAKWYCIVILFSMVVVMFLEVLMRFVFNSPIGWAENYVKFSLISVAFLGASLTIRMRSQISVKILWNKFPSLLTKIMQVVIDIVVLAFFVGIIILGYKAAALMPGVYPDMWGIKRSYAYMILPSTSVIVVIQCLFAVMESTLRLFGKEEVISTCPGSA